MASKRKRVLLVDLGAPWGGVETYIEHLADLLSDTCELYCICALPRLEETLRQRGVHVVCLPFLYTRFAKAARLIVAFPILIYLIARYGIRTVQFNGYLESWYIPFVRALGCRVVRTAHGPSEIDRYKWYRAPHMYIPRLGSMISVRFASHVVCVSEAVRTDTEKYIEGGRLSVVPNWVQQSSSVTGISPDRAPASPQQVLYVGRLEEYKGVHLLLLAARALPFPVRLVIVGVGKYRAALEKLAIGLDVTFMGFQGEPARFYQEADVFVNPSLGPEGLPITSLEAMAAGVPCIFSDLPVHTEISEGGQAAALFRCGDERELGSVLASVLDQPMYRQRLRTVAQEVIRRKYSPEAALPGYLEAFTISSE